MTNLRLRARVLANLHRRRAIALCSLALACVIITTTALGHSASTYPRKRPADNYRIDVHFNKSVPGGRTRSRIIDGAKVWNRLGRLHVFVPHRKAISNHEACPDRDGDVIGVVKWTRIDGDPEENDVLATNTNCKFASGPDKGKLSGFTQVYDSAQGSWYRGTGNAKPSRTDIWSVASHEMGHATGWRGHFKEEDEALCPSDPSRHTMCENTLRGTEMQRTPARHDKHTFKRVYPAR